MVSVKYLRMLHDVWGYIFPMRRHENEKYYRLRMIIYSIISSLINNQRRKYFPPLIIDENDCRKFVLSECQSPAVEYRAGRLAGRRATVRFNTDRQRKARIRHFGGQCKLCRLLGIE